MMRNYPHNMRQIANDIWVQERPFKLLGMDMGVRMTLIKLADGSLFVHSPVSLDSALREEIDRLGRVAFVVAPNRLHHLFVGEYFAAYPTAAFYAAPGLESKRPDLKFTGVLGNEAPSGWAGQIDQIHCDGSRFLNEMDFYHRASRTLMLTDIAFNICRTESRLGRIVLTIDQSYGHFGSSLVGKLMLLRARSKWRATIDQMLHWDFDRIIVCHGDIVESDGKETFRRAFAFL
jgi:hypothetical protein